MLNFFFLVLMAPLLRDEVTATRCFKKAINVLYFKNSETIILFHVIDDEKANMIKQFNNMCLSVHSHTVIKLLLD